MMVMPSKEFLHMTNVLDEWTTFDSKTEMLILKEDAPKEAQEMYQIYLQKYASKF